MLVGYPRVLGITGIQWYLSHSQSKAPEKKAAWSSASAPWSHLHQWSRWSHHCLQRPQQYLWVSLAQANLEALGSQWSSVQTTPCFANRVPNANHIPKPKAYVQSAGAHIQWKTPIADNLSNTIADPQKDLNENTAPEVRHFTLKFQTSPKKKNRSYSGGS